MYTDEPSDEFQRCGVGEKKNSKLEGIVVVDFFFFCTLRTGGEIHPEEYRTRTGYSRKPQGGSIYPVSRERAVAI